MNRNNTQYKSLEEAVKILLGYEVKPRIPNSMLLPIERDSPELGIIAPLGLPPNLPGHYIIHTNRESVSDEKLKSVFEKYYKPLGFEIAPFEYGFKAVNKHSGGDLLLEIVNESKDKGLIYIDIWNSWV